MTITTPGGTFNTSELILVADGLEDDDFHFLLRSELPDGVPTDPAVQYILRLLEHTV